MEDKQGPDYMSAKEWESRVDARRKKSLKMLSFLPLALLAVGAYYVYSMVSPGLMAKKRLLEALNTPLDYQVLIYQGKITPSQPPFIKEIRAGSNWEISLMGGKIQFLKVGSAYVVQQPDLGDSREYDQWYGGKLLLADLAAQVRNLGDFNGFLEHRSPISVSLSPEGNTYRYRVAHETYAITLDRQNGFPTKLTVTSGRDEDDAQPLLQALIEPLSKPQLDPIAPNKVEDLGQPKLPFALTGDNNQKSTVVGADINVHGDAFFLIRNLPDVLVKNIVREHGDRLYTPEIKRLTRSDDLTRVTYTASDARKQPWPTTLEATFIAPDKKVIGFKYTFNGPTCFALPNKASGPSDLAVIRFLYDEDQKLGSSLNDPPQVVLNDQGAPLEPVDVVEEQTKLYQQAIFYGILLLPSGRVDSEDVLHLREGLMRAQNGNQNSNEFLMP